MIMILKMAWKNIWRNWTRSLVIMLSVAAGLFAGLFVLALYKGMMKGRVKTVIYAETGHLQMHQTGFSAELDPELFIDHHQSVLSFLHKDPRIAMMAPRTIATGMISNARGSSGVNLIGIDPEEEDPVSGLSQKMREGEWKMKGIKKGILVGKKLANKMGLELGKKVVITMTDTTDEMISAAFRITGIYQSSNAPLDEINVYMKAEDLQTMLSMPGKIHEISIVLKQDEMLSSIIADLKNKYPSLAVESWDELSPETSLMVNTMDYYSYIILIIILIALSFGIMNTMMMAVLERRKEISMMMALGMSAQQLLRMILTETILLTSIGIPFSWIISQITIGYYAKKGIDMSGLREEMMQSFGFSTTIYPSFPSEKMVPIMMMVLITALLSSIVPMIKTSKMKPSTALQQ
jgi:ABC-type lipoprotein release transport system permease subunit